LTYDPEQLQYEALHFITAEQNQDNQIKNNLQDNAMANRFRTAIQSIIEDSRLVTQSRVHLNIRRDEYIAVKALVERTESGSFFLPDDWSFLGLSILAFRKIFLSLKTLCIIDSLVHSEYAKAKGDEGEGYTVFETFVWMGSKEQLVRRVAEFEPELSVATVDSILQLLVYDRETAKPDPALQPIVPIGDIMMMSPRLINYNDLERNLVALLARKHKREYDKTTDVLEPQMLSELSVALSKRGFIVRTAARIPGRSDLPDIDVLAYEPRLNKLIIAELKWVIAPGEPYEQLSRADTGLPPRVVPLSKLVPQPLGRNLLTSSVS
jgi:hypothetical protein